MTNSEMANEIKAMVDMSVQEADPTRALGYMEAARRMSQDLYYSLWMAYHVSGTHKS